MKQGREGPAPKRSRRHVRPTAKRRPPSRVAVERCWRRAGSGGAELHQKCLALAARERTALPKVAATVTWGARPQRASRGCHRRLGCERRRLLPQPRSEGEGLRAHRRHRTRLGGVRLCLRLLLRLRRRISHNGLQSERLENSLVGLRNVQPPRSTNPDPRTPTRARRSEVTSPARRGWRSPPPSSSPSASSVRCGWISHPSTHRSPIKLKMERKHAATTSEHSVSSYAMCTPRSGREDGIVQTLQSTVWIHGLRV